MAKRCVINAIQDWSKMNEKRQQKEIMNDLWNKDERIKGLEKQLTEALDILNTTQKKLKVSIEGLRHINTEENWVIAQKCLDEIFEA